MVNEEILGGLKLALAKGESLGQAMNSFYNANYKKEEIEEAARFLTSQQAQPVQQTTVSPIPKKILPVKKVKLKKQRPVKQRPPTKIVKPQPVKTVQNVSGYGKEHKKPEGTTMTITLVFVLLLLVGILAAVFLFKSELVEFFNNLFG